MTDIQKAKRNVAKMVDGGASEQEIDSYLSSEGLSADNLRSGGKRNLLDDVSGAVSQFNKMIPFGDELAAGVGVGVDALSGKVRSPQDIGQSWDRQRGAQQQIEQGFEEAHPNVAALSRGVGLAANAAIPIGSGAMGGGSALMNAGRGAVVAGNQAALSAVADKGGLGERLGSASQASVDPVTLGLGAAFGYRSVPGGRGGKPVSSEALKAAKTAAYGDVEKTGVKYSTDAYNDFLDDLMVAGKDSRLNRKTAPKSFAILRDFVKNPPENPSLGDLEQLRKIVNRDLTRSRDDTEQYFGTMFKQHLDQLIDETPTNQMINGESSAASEAIKKARNLNSRYRKTQSVEQAIEDAKLATVASGAGANIDNNLRQQMKKVMLKSKGLSEEERKAFERVIKANPGHNFLRAVGKLSPQNGLMMSLGVGGAMVNPMLGVPLVAGGIAKTAADTMTKNNVKQLLKVVSQGSNSVSPSTAAARRLVALKAAQLTGASRGNK